MEISYNICNIVKKYTHYWPLKFGNLIIIITVLEKFDAVCCMIPIHISNTMDPIHTITLPKFDDPDIILGNPILMIMKWSIFLLAYNNDVNDFKKLNLTYSKNVSWSYFKIEIIKNMYKSNSLTETSWYLSLIFLKISNY